jgi:TFIIH basal transcription factor complex TTD-A subunit
VLIECDPSIKSIIVQIDAEDHAYIVEELDDQTLVVKENMLTSLKMKLDEVVDHCYIMSVTRLTLNAEIKAHANTR